MSHSQQPPLGPADPGNGPGSSGGGTGGFGPSSYLSGPLGTQGKPPASARDRLVLGLLVASLVLGLLGTAGIVYGLNKDDEPTVAGPSTGGGEDPSESPSESSSESPSESPEETPSETAETPDETPSETETPDPPDPDERLKASEYRDDWNFRLGDVKLSAKNAGSWNYKTCGPVEKDRTLTKKGCRYAVEATYKARGGNLQFTHIFFGMKSDDAAEKAAKQMKEEHFNIQDGRFLANFTAGKFRTGASGEIVVVTVATRTDNVTNKVLDEYLKYAHVDFKSALLFRSIG